MGDKANRHATTQPRPHARVPYIDTVFNVRFSVRFLRFRGRVVPARQVANQRPQVGDLRIEECHDELLKRTLRIARLVDLLHIVNQDVPQLLDVKVVAMSPQAFTLTGFERIDEAEFAQSWLCTPE